MVICYKISWNVHTTLMKPFLRTLLFFSIGPHNISQFQKETFYNEDRKTIKCVKYFVMLNHHSEFKYNWFGFENVEVYYYNANQKVNASFENIESMIAV